MCLDEVEDPQHEDEEEHADKVSVPGNIPGDEHDDQPMFPAKKHTDGLFIQTCLLEKLQHPGCLPDRIPGILRVSRFEELPGQLEIIECMFGLSLIHI